MNGLRFLPWWTVCVLLLTACTSVYHAPPESDLTAKRFPDPKPGWGAIYLYRGASAGTPGAVDVALDGRVGGWTGPDSYFRWDVEPGKHRIAAYGANHATLQVEVMEGQIIFVRQVTSMGMFAPGVRLEQVSPEEGVEGVLAGRLLMMPPRE